MIAVKRGWHSTENTLGVSKLDMSTIVTRGEEIDKSVAQNVLGMYVVPEVDSLVQRVHVKSSCC